MLKQTVCVELLFFNSESLFAILHEYTHNTDRANNTDVYDDVSHQTKYEEIIR